MKQSFVTAAHPKRMGSPYISRRSRHRVKSKNPDGRDTRRGGRLGKGALAMSVAPETGRNRIMMALTSWSSRQPMARHWRSACRLERPACSSTFRSGCHTGCLCRTLPRQHGYADARGRNGGVREELGADRRTSSGAGRPGSATGEDGGRYD